MADYQTIEADIALSRVYTLVRRDNGNPITSGTINYYLKRYPQNEWWRNSDSTWQATETANPMTHEADGHWKIDLTTAFPFAHGVSYLEYVKESGNLHVPVKTFLRAEYVVKPARYGTAQGGTVNSITLDSGAGATTNAWTGSWIEIISGPGLTDGQRLITSYNGSTKVATVYPPWATAIPTTATVFLIWKRPAGGINPAPFTGIGTRTVTVTVNDGANPIQNASVRMAMGVENYNGLTNVSGQVVFNLNDGTWTVSIVRVGYTFAGASLVVDGTETPTYSMTPMTFTSSPVGQTTGFLIAYDQNGAAEVGIQLNAQAVQSSIPGVSIDSTIRVVTSVTAGLVEFPNLFKGVTYRFWRGTGDGTTGRTITYFIPLNAAATHELPAIIGAP